MDASDLRTVMKYKDCPLTPAGDCCEVKNLKLVPICRYCESTGEEDFKCSKLEPDGKEK